MSEAKLRIVLRPLGVFDITDDPLKENVEVRDGGHLVELLKHPLTARKAILSLDPDGVNLNLTLTDEE